MAAATFATSMFSVCGSMSTKTGLAPDVQDAVGGRDERERGGDDLVPRADAGGEHGAVQPGGARWRRRRRAAGRRSSRTPLELLDPRPDRQRARVQHVDDGVDLLLRDVGLGEGDAERHAVRSVERAVADFRFGLRALDRKPGARGPARRVRRPGIPGSDRTSIQSKIVQSESPGPERVAAIAPDFALPQRRRKLHYRPRRSDKSVQVGASASGAEPACRLVRPISVGSHKPFIDSEFMPA